MQYDKKFLGKQAKEKGFVRDTFEKVCRLADILQFFEQDDLLSKYLLLKGGTAINLVFLELPRLSVDIDLDFSKNLEKAEMEDIKEKINGRIKRYIEANGYELSEKTKHHFALDSFVCSYYNAGGNKDNLKIEINYMNRCHILEPVLKKAYTPWRDDEIMVACVAPVEIYASKTVALFNRTAPRDLYDIYNMIKFRMISDDNWDMYRKCVVFYSAIGAENVPDEFSFECISGVSAQQIRTILRPVLRNGEKFDLQAVRQDVLDFLGDVLVIEENEREFWECFRKKEFRPEYLLGMGKEWERVKAHPMARWKCKILNS